MTTTYLRICLRAMLALLWAPSLVFAASAAFVIDGEISVSAPLVLISAMLASLSGATALVIRIDKELRASAGAALPRPWLFCSAHMLGSWLAGTLAFIFAQQQQGMDVWLKLAAVIVASFIGAKFIELAAERWLPRVLPLGPSATPATPTPTEGPTP